MYKLHESCYMEFVGKHHHIFKSVGAFILVNMTYFRTYIFSVCYKLYLNEPRMR